MVKHVLLRLYDQEKGENTCPHYFYSTLPEDLDLETRRKKKTVWEGSKLSLFIHDIKVWTKISMDYVKTFRMNKWL